jgi:hypothetical protein
MSSFPKSQDLVYNTAERKLFQEGKENIEQCLKIRAEASKASRAQEFLGATMWGRDGSKSQRVQENNFEGCHCRQCLSSGAEGQSPNKRLRECTSGP